MQKGQNVRYMSAAVREDFKEIYNLVDEIGMLLPIDRNYSAAFRAIGAIKHIIWERNKIEVK